jgi:hypothetical protein
MQAREIFLDGSKAVVGASPGLLSFLRARHANAPRQELLELQIRAGWRRPDLPRRIDLPDFPGAPSTAPRPVSGDGNNTDSGRMLEVAARALSRGAP